MNGKIVIAKINSTHGIKGFSKITSYAENPEDVFNLNLFFGNGDSVVLKKISQLKEDVFVSKINDICDVDEAKQNTNTLLYVERSELPETEEEEFYTEDLVGLSVLVEDESTPSGTVIQVQDFSAGINIEIEWNDGKIEAIPFKEEFILDVNAEDKIIIISKPEYI